MSTTCSAATASCAIPGSRSRAERQAPRRRVASPPSYPGSRTWPSDSDAKTRVPFPFPEREHSSSYGPVAARTRLRPRQLVVILLDALRAAQHAVSWRSNKVVGPCNKLVCNSNKLVGWSAIFCAEGRSKCRSSFKDNEPRELRSRPLRVLHAPQQEHRTNSRAVVAPVAVWISLTARL